MAGAAAILGHVALLLAVLSGRATPPAVEPPPMVLSLIDLTPPARPAPPSETPDSAAAAPAAAAAVPVATPTPEPKRRPAPRLVPPIAPTEVAPRLAPPSPPAPAPEATVSAAQLAAATTADSEGAAAGGSGEGTGQGGSGEGSGGGGRCDMVRRLQTALRRDGRIEAAVRRAPGGAARGSRPLVVWNGDWVQSGGEDGKGLAGLRQAIAVEVAFAPKACRTQAMRGLVLISLNDAPGSPRVVLGADRWRWSDMVFAR
jgi:hypothetical protein